MRNCGATTIEGALMTNAAFGKKVLAIAVLACLCAALIAVPAYGFYYVHDDSVSDSSDGLGSYEVFMVVDETAVVLCGT